MKMFAAAAVMMVAGSAMGTIVLSEDFEGGAIPAGWTIVDNEGTGMVYDIMSPSTMDGSAFMLGFDSDAAGVIDYDTEAWTPVMDLSGYSSATLDYDGDYENLANLDFFDVDVSYDGGATWTNLVSYNDDMGIFHDTLAFNGGSATTVLRFHYYDPSRTGDWDWHSFVDNVVVDAVPAPGTLALLGLGGLAIRRRR
ncbi:MAG TPA: PEP-CTERM sorting domain-containing protein [Phycisphaeraceae bacterium]|nr:PEP-CTERM sorting domain-containing protein [Phycisphaeraceae bacterium]